MSDDQYKEIFSKNLKKHMALHDKTQADLIRDLGFNRSAVSTWYNGTRLPRMDKVDVLANYFGINRSDLIEEHSYSTTKGKIQGVRIPVIGEIIAGIPIDAIEDILDYEEISSQMAINGDYFGLRVKGHSMEPRICEGDVVIVKQQSDVESGDIAVVFVNGNEATLKKVIKQENGITLIAFNTNAYEPHFYTNGEIETLPIQIKGKVVELRGKF